MKSLEEQRDNEYDNDMTNSNKQHINSIDCSNKLISLDGKTVVDSINDNKSTSTHDGNRIRIKKYIEDRGFHIRDGIKYGLDYLVYTDDPSKVHSKYGLIINDKISYQELIAYQRICNSNNKELLVAFMRDENVVIMKYKRFIPNN